MRARMMPVLVNAVPPEDHAERTKVDPKGIVVELDAKIEAVRAESSMDAPHAVKRELETVEIFFHSRSSNEFCSHINP